MKLSKSKANMMQSQLKPMILKTTKVLVEIFNNHYLIIVQKTGGLAPKIYGNSTLVENDSELSQKLLSTMKIISNFQNRQN